MRELPIRADLRDVEPYVSPQFPARFRMNTNESPYAPPPSLVAEVAREIERSELNRYPDHDADSLHEALARASGWDRNGVWIANGSNEVFLHLFLAYGGPGRTSLTFDPTYSLHTLIPRVTGTRTLQVPRDENHQVDIDAAIEMIRRERPDVVIVCSPNNPTGNLEPVATIEALLEEAPGVLVVDEAYIEFAPEGTGVRSLLAAREGLVVTRSFSKAWRLAGVRLGYLMASPDLVQGLARVRLPYHLSYITQVVGEAALRYRAEMLDTVRRIREERDRMVTGMQSLGVRTFPSAANFVLFEVSDANSVWQALLDQGVLVRNYPSVPALEGSLRVTAGLPEETDAFLEALGEVLGA
jgi:histidinol-phosphate aminotransferase